MKSFARIPFEAVFADESGGNLKTPQSEYLDTGKFPVVDQGKALVAGYVDDPRRLCGNGRPAIVFGDHTRCIKYVNFPFCMGADGVKILRPKIQADLKYLYHYLRTIKLPDGGYDRHFKYLKRIEIALPSLDEQRRIATILDKVGELRTKRREALALLDGMAQSIFVDMFGDPATNPKGWTRVPFSDLCSRVTVGIVVRPASYYRDHGVPALRSLNIRPGRISLDDLVFFSQKDNDEVLAKTKLRKNDLILVRSGRPGTAAIVPAALDGVNAIDILIASPLMEKANPHYLCEFFNSSGGQAIVLASQRGQVQKHLNVGSLNEAMIPLPPVSLQNEFAQRLAALLRLKERNCMHSDVLASLQDGLQFKAFRGEL